MTAITWPTPSSHYISQPLGGTYHTSTSGEPVGYLKKDSKGPVAVHKTARSGYVYQRYCHDGVDIGSLPIGKQVLSCLPGKVTVVTGTQATGRYIVVQHANGWSSLYGHLSAFKVSVGQSVAAGQLIGLSGDSGFATGPHCHFELRHKEADGTLLYYNPLRFVAGGDLVGLLDPQPVPATVEGEMKLTKYLPDYKVTIPAGWNVRTAPSTTAPKVRLLTAPEVWTLLGEAQGDAVGGNTNWFVRVNGLAFEFVHSSAGTPVAPTAPVADCTAAVKAATDPLKAQIASDAAKFEAIKNALA